MRTYPLIVGSICAVVLLILGSSNLVLASEGKPDLIIEDLLILPGNHPFEEDFICLVKNVGDATIPFNKAVDIIVTVRWKTLGLIPLIPIKKFNAGIMGSLAPGEAVQIPFASKDSMPIFGFYTFYCKVNPEFIIDESNIRNNIYAETVLFLFQISIFSYKNLFFNLFFNPSLNQYKQLNLE